jgi:hypothetical protein
MLQCSTIVEGNRFVKGEARAGTGDHRPVIAKSHMGRAFPEIKPLSFIEFGIFP